MSLNDAQYYQRGQIRRLRLGVEELHATVDQSQRTESLAIVQTMQQTLMSLSASLRENMPAEDHPRRRKTDQL